MPIPTAPLVRGMILASDANLMSCFTIVEKVDDDNTVLRKVTWSVPHMCYKDDLDATLSYMADDDLRAQYSIIEQ